jgi:hypothetical protein
LFPFTRRSPPPFDFENAPLESYLAAAMSTDISTTSSPSHKIILATLPPFFNGDKAKWENFADSLGTYLAAYDEEFDTDKKKVFFTLSLLRNADGSSCSAVDWVRNWKRQNLAFGALPASYKFETMVGEMKAAFEDVNLMQMAHLKLTTTRQGRMSLTEFLSQFELQAVMAGYLLDKTDKFLIELLEGLVNDEIVSQMFLGGVALPTTYKEYKERLVQIDGNRQRSLIRRSRTGVMVPARTTPAAVMSQRQSFQGATPNLAKSLASGPVPMDVDKQGQKSRPFTCYNCGKPGHIRRNCPDPPRQKFNLRAVSAQIDDLDQDSEELKALAEKLRERGF